MGTYLDRVALAVGAKAWIPPHMSVTADGHPYRVKGYWRAVAHPASQELTSNLREQTGSGTEIVDTAPELHDAYLAGISELEKVRVGRGLDSMMARDGVSPSQVYGAMNIVQAAPEGVTARQKAEIKKQVDEFTQNPRIESLFQSFGKPRFAVAAKSIGVSDAGENPFDQGTLAQWSNGTVFLFGPSFGNYVAAEKIAEPGFTLASNGPQWTLRHEYGHQVAFAGLEHPSPPPDEFIASMAGGITREDAVDAGRAMKAMDNVRATAKALHSEYSASSIDEAWAEVFTAVTDPAYDPAKYGEAARPVLDWMQGWLREQTQEGVKAA
jgi:hypothetical protein